MFDISSSDSFAKAKAWVKELQRQGNPNMIMSLAGNKADLADSRQVRLQGFCEPQTIVQQRPAAMKRPTRSTRPNYLFFRMRRPRMCSQKRRRWASFRV